MTLNARNKRLKPTNEHRLWAIIRPHIPFYWRLEDKLAVGRADVLYRLPLRNCDNAGILELKMHPVPPSSSTFWSKLETPQARSLIEWGEFNNGKANLLMGLGGEWLLFGHKSDVVQTPRQTHTLAEFYALARNKGQLDEAGIKRLVLYLEELHMGRTQ